MLAVQECYISVCKEKDMLEQREQSRGEEEEAWIKENEVRLEPNCGWIKDRWQFTIVKSYPMHTLPVAGMTQCLVPILRKT